MTSSADGSLRVFALGSRNCAPLQVRIPSHLPLYWQPCRGTAGQCPCFSDVHFMTLCQIFALAWIRMRQTRAGLVRFLIQRPCIISLDAHYVAFPPQNKATVDGSQHPVGDGDARDGEDGSHQEDSNGREADECSAREEGMELIHPDVAAVLKAALPGQRGGSCIELLGHTDHVTCAGTLLGGRIIVSCAVDDAFKVPMRFPAARHPVEGSLSLGMLWGWHGPSVARRIRSCY